MKLKDKKRELTDTEKLKKAVPKFGTVPCKIKTDMQGNIISIETDDKDIIAYAKELGLS